MITSIFYHEISDSIDTQYTINLDTFHKQMNILANEDYVVEGIDGLVRRIEMNTHIPTKYILLSFDDGYKSDLIVAEILQKYGFNATFFITPKHFNRNEHYLTKDEVKMLSQNFHIGSHGLTHSNLTTLKNENLKMEFINSKHLLEEIIGKSVDVISAPGGYMNYATKNIGLLNGYNFVATSIEWPVTKRFMTQRKTINRTCIRNTFSESTYKKILSNDLSFFMMRRLRAGIYYFPKKLIDKKLV